MKQKPNLQKRTRPQKLQETPPRKILRNPQISTQERLKKIMEGTLNPPIETPQTEEKIKVSPPIKLTQEIQTEAGEYIDLNQVPEQKRPPKHQKTEVI